MQALYLLGATLLIFILLFVLQTFIKEGFGASEDTAHSNFSKLMEQKYNNVGAALAVRKREGGLGGDTRGLFGNVSTTVDDNDKIISSIDNPFPLEENRSGLFAVIDKCEAIKTDNCSAFDDASFANDCGICLDIGTNSENKPATGGLVLTSEDKQYYGEKAIPSGSLIRTYEPTIGTCPAKRMVSNKAECLRMKKQIECEKNTTFESPEGCSQCYDSEGNYLVLDAANKSSSGGTLYLIGSGNINFNGNNRQLSTTTPTIFQIPNESGWASLTLVLQTVSAPEPYDNTKIYSINDLIIFNSGVYKMREGAGQPGINPNTQGNSLWVLQSALSEYNMPAPGFIAGYLASPNATATTATGYFQIDFYRLILSDSETGRKPRATATLKLNGIDVTKMEPGHNKFRMTLATRYPFTFANQGSQEATICRTSPFITKAAAAEFLDSDPCYKKGSGPGSYKLECIQATFLANGCTDMGKGYPKSNTETSALLYNGTTALTLSQIADKIYAMAVLTSTGIKPDGTKASIEDWSKASVFCTGSSISTPCDIPTKETGPLSSECITYLWDNSGQNNTLESTYSTSLFSSAWSLFNTSSESAIKLTDRKFCTRNGTRSPKNANGTDNTTNMTYWKSRGGVAAVKILMASIHSTANNPAPPEDPNKAAAILQCYGVVARPRYEGFRTNYISDTSSTVIQSYGPRRDYTNPVVSSPVDVSVSNEDRPIVFKKSTSLNFNNFIMAATLGLTGWPKDNTWWGGGSFCNPACNELPSGNWSGAGNGNNMSQTCIDYSFTSSFKNGSNAKPNCTFWADLDFRTVNFMIDRVNNQGVVRIAIHTGGYPPAGVAKVWTSNPITRNSDLFIDVSYSSTDKIMSVNLSGAVEQTANINDVTFYRYKRTPGKDEWTFNNPFNGPMNVPIFASGTGSKQGFNGLVKYLYIGDPPVATAASGGTTTVRGPGPGWNL